MHRKAVKNGPKGCGMRGWEKHAYLRHASTFEGEAGAMLSANTKTKYLREPETKYIFFLNFYFASTASCGVLLLSATVAYAQLPLYSKECFTFLNVPPLDIASGLTFSRLMTHIYIYIYMSYRTANLQMLHFIYLFNKYTY